MYQLPQCISVDVCVCVCFRWTASSVWTKRWAKSTSSSPTCRISACSRQTPLTPLTPPPPTPTQTPSELPLFYSADFIRLFILFKSSSYLSFYEPRLFMWSRVWRIHFLVCLRIRIFDGVAMLWLNVLWNMFFKQIKLRLDKNLFTLLLFFYCDRELWVN